MRAANTRRLGFTLIELLVVIAIIAILAALVTTTIARFLNTGTNAQATHEIRQLALGLENFKQKYGMYPPSTFWLPPTDDPSGDSKKYALVMWPRISDFSICNWGATEKIYGDQCLVYFLRGPTGDGWSTNPKNPTQTKATPTETRGGPFFEFPEGRLEARPGFVTKSFKDPFETPAKKQYYVYFSSYRRPNGYLDSDAVLGVSPFYKTVAGSPKRYYNPNSFQIISAGVDFQFGQGGSTWPSGADYASETAKGFDDLSNFHSAVLGAP